MADTERKWDEVQERKLDTMERRLRFVEEFVGVGRTPSDNTEFGLLKRVTRLESPRKERRASDTYPFWIWIVVQVVAVAVVLASLVVLSIYL